MDVETQTRLIEVGIELFGKNGLEATSTRAIAKAANVQLSAIGYHFGNKESLYLACAKSIAADLKTNFEAVLTPRPKNINVSEASLQIESILSGMTAVMMRSEIESISRFVLREQMNPTAAFEVVFESAMRPLVERLVLLLSVVARHRLNKEEIQIRCMTLMGQVFAFRFAQTALLHVTKWPAIKKREIALAQKAVTENARAILKELSKKE